MLAKRNLRQTRKTVKCKSSNAAKPDGCSGSKDLQFEGSGPGVKSGFGPRCRSGLPEFAKLSLSVEASAPAPKSTT